MNQEYTNDVTLSKAIDNMKLQHKSRSHGFLCGQSYRHWKIKQDIDGTNVGGRQETFVRREETPYAYDTTQQGASLHRERKSPDAHNLISHSRFYVPHLQWDGRPLLMIRTDALLCWVRSSSLAFFFPLLRPTPWVSTIPSSAPANGKEIERQRK